jgi:hypothetical protein
MKDNPKLNRKTVKERLENKLKRAVVNDLSSDSEEGIDKMSSGN